ncbi:hypothetical protein H4219_006064, partial [Mycoemilia scoparia]
MSETATNSAQKGNTLPQQQKKNTAARTGPYQQPTEAPETRSRLAIIPPSVAKEALYLDVTQLDKAIKTSRTKQAKPYEKSKAPKYRYNTVMSFVSAKLNAAPYASLTEEGKFMVWMRSADQQALLATTHMHVRGSIIPWRIISGSTTLPAVLQVSPSITKDEIITALNDYGSFKRMHMILDEHSIWHGGWNILFNLSPNKTLPSSVTIKQTWPDFEGNEQSMEFTMRIKVAGSLEICQTYQDKTINMCRCSKPAKNTTSPPVATQPPPMHSDMSENKTFTTDTQDVKRRPATARITEAMLDTEITPLAKSTPDHDPNHFPNIPNIDDYLVQVPMDDTTDTTPKRNITETSQLKQPTRSLLPRAASTCSKSVSRSPGTEHHDSIPPIQRRGRPSSHSISNNPNQLLSGDTRELNPNTNDSPSKVFSIEFANTPNKYTCFHSNSLDGIWKFYDTCILVHDSHEDAKLIPEISNARCTVVSLASQGIILVNVYIELPIKEEHFDTLLDIILPYHLAGWKLILGGNFNCALNSFDHHDITTSNYNQGRPSFQHLISSLNLADMALHTQHTDPLTQKTPLNSLFTFRCTNSSKPISRLDYFFVTKDLSPLSDCWYNSDWTKSSDHAYILLDIPASHTTSYTKPKDNFW